MKSPTIVRTAEIVARSTRNYPAVMMDMSKELKNQGIATAKSLADLGKLMLKALGIITFPIWILPLALAMYVTFRVCEAHPVPQIHKAD